MLEVIGLLLPGITAVLNKIIPDANARQAAQDQITQALIAQQGAVQQAISEAAKAQAEINAALAKQNPDMQGGNNGTAQTKAMQMNSAST